MRNIAEYPVTAEEVVATVAYVCRLVREDIGERVGSLHPMIVEQIVGMVDPVAVADALRIDGGTP